MKGTGSMFTAEQVERVVSALVDVANAQADAVLAEGGRPIHRRFGFDVLKKQVRVWARSGNSKTVRCFVSLDLAVHRGESWKRAGRPLFELNAKTTTRATDLLLGQILPPATCMCGEVNPSTEIADDGLERTTCCGCH